MSKDVKPVSFKRSTMLETWQTSVIMSLLGIDTPILTDYSVLIGYIHSAQPERRTARGHGRASKPRHRAPGSAAAVRNAMDIIVSNASDKPIYEQIASQMKNLIMSGKLTEGQQLPSIRALANDLRISVITTKRAYADLEAQGFIETVQGKGSFVAGQNLEMVREEHLRRTEGLLNQAVTEARSAGISPTELHDMLDLALEP